MSTTSLLERPDETFTRLAPDDAARRAELRDGSGREGESRERRSFLQGIARLPFGLQATALLTALLGVQYWPLVTGRVALPTRFLQAYSALSTHSAPGVTLKSQQLTDLTTQQYPWQMFDAAALRAGHLPLWDPHVLMGTPQVASWLPAVFDPWHLGYLLMPVSVWWNLLFPLHQLAAGVGAALLARRFTGSRPAGLVAGMMYGFSGYIVGHNGQNQGEVGCLLPWLLLGIAWLASDPKLRRSIGVALVLAAMVLAGHPETFLFSCVTAAVLAIALMVRAGQATALRFGLHLVGAGAIGLGLSAVQWLPGIGWLFGSTRVQDGALDVHAAHIGLLDLFSRDASSALNSVGILLPSAATYVGIGGIVLALFGLARWRHDLLIPTFAVLAVVSGLVAFGVPPLYTLATMTPLVRGMRLDFVLMVTDLSLAMLAAYGLVHLRAVASVRTNRLLYAISAAVLAVGIVLLVRNTERHLALGASLVHGPLAAALFAVAMLVLVLPPVIRTRAGLVLLLAVMALDLTTWSSGYREFSSSTADAYATPPVLTALERYDPSTNYRVLNVGRTMPLDFAIALGTNDPLGYGPYETNTVRYWSGLTHEPPTGHISPLARSIAQAPAARLDLADVKYVLASRTPSGGAGWLRHDPGAFRLVLQVGSVDVFRNLGDLGPAVVVPLSGVRRADGAVAERALAAPGFSARDEALVPTALGDATATDSEATAPAAACNCVSGFRDDGDTTSFQVDAARPSLVVVSQSWYPGWRATVNGRPALISAANLDLTGVEVPAGTSTVVLRFQPSVMAWGIVATLSTAGGLLVFGAASSLVVLRRRRRAE